VINMTRKYTGPAAVFLLTLFLAACASAPGGVPVSISSPGRSIPEEYTGSGRSESLLQAVNEAKMDAVRKAVIQIIGSEAEARQRDVLQDVLYGTSNPNQYVFSDSMETLRRENLGTIDEMDMIYEIRIKVNIDRVRETLDRNGIGRDSDAGGAQAAGAQSAVAEAQGDAGPQSVDISEPDEEPADTDGGAATVGPAESGSSAAAMPDATPAEQEFVQRYLDSLSYMVFYPEDNEVDSFLMNTAVSQANSWLAGAGYQVVDPDQIEELKADASLAYEEQTGGEISILQWIAQRLSADVYVEIEASATTRSDGGRHYAQALLALKMYETSTARLLGSIPYTSPETFSRSSQDDALANALQSSVYQAMPYVLEQSRIQIARQIENGIRYELVFINTADSRLMSSFRSRLRSQVRDLETLSQSEGETRYAVYLFGRNDEVEDLVYRVADQTPGMEFLSLVLTRGKSLTFDTGLVP
jgi:hypothetical protein